MAGTNPKKGRKLKHDYLNLPAPCSRCNLPFGYGVSHLGWEAVECKREPYTDLEIRQMVEKYNQHFRKGPLSFSS